MDKSLKDHKQIGQELELFFNNDISPGAVYWLPKGMVIFKELERYIRLLTEKAGYLETSTPIMVKSELFKQSGHWEKFGEHNMYNLILSEDLDDSKPEIYTLKPMNCPESTILYRFRPRSYKELPLRLSELGRLHRREKSGEVNGLLRVRQLTMDDAHIYVAEEGIFEEISNILDMMMEFYDKFSFEYDFRLATRPEKFAGTPENWKKAETDLERALKDKKLKYSFKIEDGAFYGPKIDVHIKDTHDREWQLATVQLDFHMPEAFDLKYIDKDGQNKRPVMIHRAIFGSLERFIAILTENFQGAFPTWLSPLQVKIIPIADRHLDYAREIAEKLKDSGIRVEIDEKSEKMQAKIRDAQEEKIPYMIILGDKEQEEKKISVRKKSGENQNLIELEEFLSNLTKEIALFK